MYALKSFLGSVLGFCCTVQLICCLTLWLVFAHAKAQGASPTHELVEVRSMENCPPCDRVLAKLKADGVAYTVKPTGMVTATSFPCCIYKSGDWDSGAHILNSNYTVSGTIPITKLVQK
jgi:hypothetical protein